MNITDNQQKKEIIARLITAGHISFEESLVLLSEPTVTVSPLPWPLIDPINPYNPYPVMYTTSAQ